MRDSSAPKFIHHFPNVHSARKDVDGVHVDDDDGVDEPQTRDYDQDDVVLADTRRVEWEKKSTKWSTGLIKDIFFIWNETVYILNSWIDN